MPLVNEALAVLASKEPRKAELVKLHDLMGMSSGDAGALGIAVPAAKQWWAYARACLSVELSDSVR